MRINKTKVFVTFVSAKSCMHIIEKKDDFQIVADLISENQYVASVHKILELSLETLEYVVSINF
jgi:hypothetical protein